MASVRSWALTALFLAACVSFLLLGFVSQSRVLAGNRCKMTYSQPHFQQLGVQSGVQGYQLLIHGTVEVLNPTPVLFIPGNSGSAKQARSFASSTHNADENFQYFAVHFDRDKSATHGSVALKQAVFVNDAIAKILELYENSTDYDNPVDVILLAHSAGGMVARTSLLLSNHPHHSVSSLIMLGTPNTRPTYTPDVSLDVLYRRVNLAWRRSMYYTSTACQEAHLRSLGLYHGEVVTSSAVSENSSAVSASWDCSVNVPRLRVVSISGGEIDMEVPSPLSSLSSLAPRPQNASMESPTPQKLSTFLKPKGGYVRWIFTQLVALPSNLIGFVSRILKWAYSGASASHATESVNASQTAPNTSSHDAFRRMEDIPQEHWDAHVVPYLEPQHISVRTSQLAGVGFPVDHKALLWCHQVLQSTSRIMTRLAALPPDVTLSGQELSSKIVKLKSRYALPTWPLDVVRETCVSDDSAAQSSTCSNGDIADNVPILPVQEELCRNASKHFFSRVALDDERQYLVGLLTRTPPDVQGKTWGSVVGSLSVLSLALVTAHLPTVMACYVLISLLVMATFVLYFTSTKNKWSVSSTSHLYNNNSYVSELTLLLPENHLFLCSFVDINTALLPSNLKSYFIGGSKGGKSFSTAAFIVFAGVAVVYIVRTAQNPTEFVRTNGFFFEWVVSYGAALAIHFCVLTAVHTMRMIVTAFCSTLRTIWRATVWCKPVRSALRPRLRPLRQGVLNFWAMVPAVEWIVLLLLFSTMIASSVVFGQRSSKLITSEIGEVPYVGRVIQISALLFLFSDCLFIVILTLAIVWPQKESSRLLTPCIALCLPGVILGFPTFRFCAEVYHLSLSSYKTMSTISTLVDAFGPDLINNSLAVLFMTLNLLYLQRYESKILPVAFLYEIFDVAKRARGDMSGGSFLPNIFGGNSECLHEEGGKDAVFEENGKGVKEFNKGSVLLGPALRVVSCDCSINKSLKSFGEWCEWCRCERCGGKSISQNARAKAGAWFDSDENSRARTSLGMRDVSSDLLVLVSLVAAAGYAILNASAEPFRLYLIMGGVSAIMCVARICRYGGY